jgi:hypothetical protein
MLWSGVRWAPARVVCVQKDVGERLGICISSGILGKARGIVLSVNEDSPCGEPHTKEVGY